jgi:hypothetical protein
MICRGMLGSTRATGAPAGAERGSLAVSGESPALHRGPRVIDGASGLGKARRVRIPGVFERGATQLDPGVEEGCSAGRMQLTFATGAKPRERRRRGSAGA